MFLLDYCFWFVQNPNVPNFILINLHYCRSLNNLLFFRFQAGVKTISARAIAEEETSLSDAETQCIKDLGLNEEHVRKLDDQEISPENDEQYNKYATCTWTKAKLQDDNGRIDYDAVRDLLVEEVVSELANEDEEVLFVVKQLTRRAVTYCQQHPPGGINHGQIVVKLQNCIMNKLNEMIKQADE